MMMFRLVLVMLLFVPGRQLSGQIVCNSVTWSRFAVLVDSVRADAANPASSRAWFSYVSSDSLVKSIFVGPDNFFTPGNPNRGQPRLFQPGVHRSVFSVLFNTDSLRWVLGNTCAVAYRPDVLPALASDTTGALLRVDNPTGENRLLVTDEHFIAHASGGAAIYSNAERTMGVILPANAGAWSVFSDINRKRDFADVDGEALLTRLAALPIGTWSYKTQDPSIRHMGPSAQSFRAAFGLGESDTTISTVDAAGVALAAMQALERRLAALEGRGMAAPKPPGAGALSPNFARPARTTHADDVLLNVRTPAGDQRMVVTDETMTVIAPAGAEFYARAGSGVGVQIAPGSGSWSITSDVKRKTHFANVDDAAFMRALRDLPIGTWSYIAQGPAIRHMGPSAQSFARAFGLGSSNLRINEVDLFGVALYGAQSLARRTDALIEQLR